MLFSDTPVTYTLELGRPLLTYANVLTYANGFVKGRMPGKVVHSRRGLLRQAVLGSAWTTWTATAPRGWRTI